MVDRANRADLRNPILALPSFGAVQKLDAPSQQALRALMLDLAADARAKADKSWRTHKAPMAVYWKAVSVYAGHIAKAIGRERSAHGNIDGGQHGLR
ncbi:MULTISPECIES: hypothetical protein [unclassified Novosphingobium]|uniref:hypothetical protein n=1 Tax=unclassified Novosphingobium TaxID=2644732 RepID=UPI000D3279A6|nr:MULTISPECIES: hypothetical protein [unclassified Novosphingobium]PTR06704.1 hypothetical protein C8K11_11973 [Novosphingobium sp. GV055]PUA94997.1 hypothetical protein C8K12_11973 [Novosphingobium sp. GV061]PUB14125.1 hypothetical protein C8K14_11973 [Novosphingobium sp. GV079]PUB38699.1 hypothetical protein C8K10_11973 [Novosphingobium sp. GV027]